MNRYRTLPIHIFAMLLSAGAAAQSVDLEQTIEVIADDEAFTDPFVPKEEFLTREQIEQAFKESSADATAEERGDLFATNEARESEQDSLLGFLNLDSAVLGLELGPLDSLTDVLDDITGDLDDAVGELAEISGILDLEDLLRL